MGKILVALGLMAHSISFTWQQSTPGRVQILEGTAHGGPYQVVACKSRVGKCRTTQLTSGQTYYFVAKEDGITGYSNEVTATAK